jgi:hypothetical protein
LLYFWWGLKVWLKFFFTTFVYECCPHAISYFPFEQSTGSRGLLEQQINSVANRMARKPQTVVQFCKFTR